MSHTNFGILTCDCTEYPIVSGVILLQKNAVAANVARLIKDNEYNRALRRLIQFSFLSKIFFKLTLGMQHIYKWIGYRNFILLLCVLGYPLPWAGYLLTRAHLPDYHFSLLFLSAIRSKHMTIADVGCGTGFTFPDYQKYAEANKLPIAVIGIDKNFLSLYIAHLFFSSKQTVLVCADIENGLPLKSKSVSYLVASGVINYINNLHMIVKESFRCVITAGAIVYTDIVNRNTTPPGLGIPSHKIRSIISKNSTHYSLLGGKYVWPHLVNDNNIGLLQFDKNIEKSHAYYVIFSHRTLPRTIRLARYFAKRFKNTDFGKYKRLI